MVDGVPDLGDHLGEVALEVGGGARLDDQRQEGSVPLCRPCALEMEDRPAPFGNCGVWTGEGHSTLNCNSSTGVVQDNSSTLSTEKFPTPAVGPT